MKPGLTVLYGQSPHFSTSFQTSELARHLSPWFQINERPLPQGKFARVYRNLFLPLLRPARDDYILYGNDGFLDLHRCHGKTILYWYDAPQDWAAHPPPNFKDRLRFQNVIHADHLFAVSAAQVELAKKIRAKDTHYLPVGVDCQTFDPAKIDRESVRRELGIKPDEVIVGYLGYLGNWAGRFAGQMLLEAMASTSFRLLLIGTGPALGEWEKSAIADRIIHAGYVPQDRLAATIAAADICVDTLEPGFHSEARSETKLKQYMAMGRACVATAIGENVVDLDGGRAGILVPPDSNALAKAICDLANNPEQRARLGAAARARAKSLYDWRVLSQKLVDALQF